MRNQNTRSRVRSFGFGRQCSYTANCWRTASFSAMSHPRDRIIDQQTRPTAFSRNMEICSACRAGLHGTVHDCHHKVAELRGQPWPDADEPVKIRVGATIIRDNRCQIKAIRDLAMQRRCSAACMQIAARHCIAGVCVTIAVWFESHALRFEKHV